MEEELRSAINDDDYQSTSNIEPSLSKIESSQRKINKQTLEKYKQEELKLYKKKMLFSFAITVIVFFLFWWLLTREFYVSKIRPNQTII